ncbi:hypothetical protein [Flavobacterium sp. KJJ]|uniref:hypothetical protein n=1 Tax=Flavobacterium sp. KJJ TaxID=1270193 RepID=UPI00068B1091|nr:hypothetical protein [Flavobacterium sp. KJJ]
MKNKLKAINKVFIEWNPIEVDNSSVIDEYETYSNKILQNGNDIIGLVMCLEDILINDVGLNYNPLILEQKKEVVYYAYKMYLVIISSVTD